ncbi:MAG: carboxypeptidase-like regulatory domain-containing protein, partial [Balneolaceae bacterium]
MDPVNQNVKLNNRQQVGSAALAVRLFVDKNNSGSYDDGDELLPNNAIRIERASGAIFYENGISYLNLLQPYRQYNLSVNKSAFHNPLLVPVTERFSIVTDPNQYKIIDIPLYTSGVIEGKVLRLVDGTRLPLSGARLFLRNIDVESDFSDFEQELRTFSDGSFYSYEIPPGTYEIQIDPQQLELLNMEAETVEFTVESLAEGDYLENLDITLTPPRKDTAETEDLTMRPDERNVNWLEGYPDWIQVGKWTSSQCRFPLQVGSFSTARRAAKAAVAAEKTTGLGMDIYYNAISGIYAVRSIERFEFSEAVRLAEVHINRLPDNDLSVIGQCDNRQDDLRPTPFTINIQLGAFYSKENATQLVDLMNRRYNLKPKINQENS